MRIKPITGEIYHILNRGVEKRNIYLDEEDRLRFIHSLFEFNDINPAFNFYYYFSKKNKSIEVGLPKIKREPRKLLVELYAFCLMPNHFHLMVRQKVDGGITEFMRKLGTGYTNYFNRKYERVGPLFQGKYKIVPVKENSHFLHLSYYIHLNPLDLIMPEWRDKEIKDYKKALKYLKNYRWSSYLDYIGIKNFPSLTQRSFLEQIVGNAADYKKEIINWLKDLKVKELRNTKLED